MGLSDLEALSSVLLALGEVPGKGGDQGAGPGPHMCEESSGGPWQPELEVLGRGKPRLPRACLRLQLLP